MNDYTDQYHDLIELRFNWHASNVSKYKSALRWVLFGACLALLVLASYLGA